MDSDPHYYYVYVAEFFLNGELQDLRVYEDEEHAEKDLDLWCFANGDFDRPGTPPGKSPFDGSQITTARMEERPKWRELSAQCQTLEETIVQWLRDNGDNAVNTWSNVIASVTSRSLSDVYEALVCAAKTRKIVISDEAQTDIGPVCCVQLPFLRDKFLWALADAPAYTLWSDEIASATGESLADVHWEMAQYRKIGVVDVLESRTTASGKFRRVRLNPEQLDKGWVRLYAPYLL